MTSHTWKKYVCVHICSFTLLRSRFILSFLVSYSIFSRHISCIPIQSDMLRLNVIAKNVIVKFIRGDTHDRGIHRQRCNRGMYIAKNSFAKKKGEVFERFTRVIFALHIFRVYGCKYMYIFTCVYIPLFFSSDILYFLLFYIGHISLVPKAYNSRHCTSKGHVCLYVYILI